MSENKCSHCVSIFLLLVYIAVAVGTGFSFFQPLTTVKFTPDDYKGVSTNKCTQIIIAEFFVREACVPISTGNGTSSKTERICMEYTDVTADSAAASSTAAAATSTVPISLLSKVTLACFAVSFTISVIMAILIILRMAGVVKESSVACVEMIAIFFTFLFQLGGCVAFVIIMVKGLIDTYITVMKGCSSLVTASFEEYKVYGFQVICAALLFIQFIILCFKCCCCKQKDDDSAAPANQQQEQRAIVVNPQDTGHVQMQPVATYEPQVPTQTVYGDPHRDPQSLSQGYGNGYGYAHPAYEPKVGTYATQI